MQSSKLGLPPGQTCPEGKQEECLKRPPPHFPVSEAVVAAGPALGCLRRCKSRGHAATQPGKGAGQAVNQHKEGVEHPTSQCHTSMAPHQTHLSRYSCVPAGTSGACRSATPPTLSWRPPFGRRAPTASRRAAVRTARMMRGLTGWLGTPPRAHPSTASTCCGAACR